MNVTDSYTDYMENEPTPFSAAFKYLIESDKKVTQTKIAHKTGLRQSYISALKNADRDGSEKTRRKVASYFKIPYDDFLEIGRRQIAPQPTPLEAEDVKAIVAGEINKHHTNDLERHLRNKHKAIIQDLRELEKLDPAALKEIHNYIKYQLHEKQGRLSDKALGE